MDYHDRIVIDSNVRFGKPVIKGTRISVEDILGYLSAGEEISEIIESFPQLSREDIQACFAFLSERESLIRVA